MLNVVTMYFTKPRPGDSTEGRRDFWITEGPKYLRRLYAGCARHIQEPFRFIVITDSEEICRAALGGLQTTFDTCDVPVEYRLVEDHEDVPGWWMKLKLFDPKFGITGRTLYLDLDNVVSGDLSPLLELEMAPDVVDHFYMADDVVNPGMSNGGVLYCRPEMWRDLWLEYAARSRSVRDEFSVWPRASDQAYIADRVERVMGFAPLHFQQLLPPGFILNSRAELEQGADWSKTALVIGSWKPKPHESSHPFYAQHWID